MTNTETNTTPDDLLGTHTYTGLYNPDTETPVNILTGNTPSHSQSTIEDAKSFAENLTQQHGKPYVAKSASIESQIETRSAPYSGVVFYHLSIVGGMDTHDAYAEAFDSPDYTVTHEPDYTTGEITITVTEN